MGILPPDGTRRRRGSDGRASAKGGGGGANSMTRGSGREGGERGADLSAVRMAGSVAPFYRVREAMEGSGEGNGRRHFIDAGYGSGGEGAAV
jgi:hypothetical protein